MSPAVGAKGHIAKAAVAATATSPASSSAPIRAGVQDGLWQWIVRKNRSGRVRAGARRFVRAWSVLFRTGPGSP